MGETSLEGGKHVLLLTSPVTRCFPSEERQTQEMGLLQGRAKENRLKLK